MILQSNLSVCFMFIKIRVGEHLAAIIANCQHVLGGPMFVVILLNKNDSTVFPHSWVSVFYYITTVPVVEIRSSGAYT